jgi:hypothetical protein
MNHSIASRDLKAEWKWQRVDGIAIYSGYSRTETTKCGVAFQETR